MNGLVTRLELNHDGRLAATVREADFDVFVSGRKTPKRVEWLSAYKAEFSKFTKEMSHAHDDQIDPTLDAIADMLVTGVDIYAGAIM